MFSLPEIYPDMPPTSPRLQLQLEALEEAHEALTESLRQLANEPSVGLYFVQQHVHKAVPSLLHMKSQLTDVTLEAELCTEDMKDAASAVKVMKESGPPAIIQMIKTLNSASSLIPNIYQSRGSTSQLFPRHAKPLGRVAVPLRSASFVDCRQSDEPNSNLFLEGSTVDATSATGSSLKDKPKESSLPYGESGDEGYVKSVLRSAMLRARNMGWVGSPPAGSSDTDVFPMKSRLREGPRSAIPNVAREASDKQTENKSWLPMPSHGLLSTLKQSGGLSPSIQTDGDHINVVATPQLRDDFDKFQEEHAAKLEAWLSESDISEALKAPEKAP